MTNLSDRADRRGWSDLDGRLKALDGRGHPADAEVRDIATARGSVAGLQARYISQPEHWVEMFAPCLPEDSNRANILVDPDGDDNAIAFEAVEFGHGGNDITIEYRAQAAAEAPLTVEVVGKAVIVHLEMDDSEPPEIVSTAADVLTALNEDEAASALVTAEASDFDEDAGGLVGIVPAIEPVALVAGAGTGIGFAGPGSRYTDTDTGKLYIQRGTLDQPDWKEVSTA